MLRVVTPERTDEELLAARRRQATVTRSATCTSATRGRSSAWRSGGWATAAAPRTPPRRRSPRSGASARSYRRERGPVAPWLYAVARNAIADRGRARNEPPAEPGDTISDEAGPAERGRAVVGLLPRPRALETLPENERAVLELAYWSGLSQSEIAELPRHPARYREDAHAQRTAAPLGGAGRRSWDEQTARTPDFLDLVGDEGTPEELERLRRAHDLLIAAGPPPELSPRLAEAPAKVAQQPSSLVAAAPPAGHRVPARRGRRRSRVRDRLPRRRPRLGQLPAHRPRRSRCTRRRRRRQAARRRS